MFFSTSPLFSLIFLPFTPFDWKLKSPICCQFFWQCFIFFFLHHDKQAAQCSLSFVGRGLVLASFIKALEVRAWRTVQALLHALYTSPCPEAVECNTSSPNVAFSNNTVIPMNPWYCIRNCLFSDFFLGPIEKHGSRPKFWHHCPFFISISIYCIGCNGVFYGGPSLHPFVSFVFSWKLTQKKKKKTRPWYTDLFFIHFKLII